MSANTVSELIECPLCLGKGNLERAEVLERLGMRDFARVAQLSAEEAIRLLVTKDKESEQTRWNKFETELGKRIAEIEKRQQAEVQKLQQERDTLSLRLKELEKSHSAALTNAKESERIETEKSLRDEMQELTTRLAELQAADKLAEKEKTVAVDKVKIELLAEVQEAKADNADLSRKTDDYLKEITDLREKNNQLELEMKKVARVGKKEEVDFSEEARAWPGIWISEKLSRHGDYEMAFRDPSGAAIEPKMVVDNKDKELVTADDIKKLFRDAKERHRTVAVLVTREDSQLRQIDRECRWAQEDGVWMLRTTRQWLPRDLEVLRPVFDRMRSEGPDFLQKNAALSEEIRRTLVELDDIESDLKKAARAIAAATNKTVAYKTRLEGLCATVSIPKKPQKEYDPEVETMGQM